MQRFLMFSCTCALTSAHRSEEERPLVVRRFLCVHGHRDSTILPCVSAAATCTHHKWMLKAGFVRPSRHRKHKTTRHPTRKTFADPPANPLLSFFHKRGIFAQTCRNLKTEIFCSSGIMKAAASLPARPPARPPPSVYPAAPRLAVRLFFFN